MPARTRPLTRATVILTTIGCILMPPTLPAQRLVPAGPEPWPVRARTDALPAAGRSTEGPAAAVRPGCRAQSALVLGALAFAGVEGLELAYVMVAGPIRVLVRPHLWMPDPAWGYYAAAGAAVYGAVRPLPRCRGR